MRQSLWRRRKRPDLANVLLVRGAAGRNARPYSANLELKRKRRPVARRRKHTMVDITD
jgi:hypothetical protein